MVTLSGVIPGIVDAHVHFYDPMRSTWALSRYARVATMPLMKRFPRPALWISGMLTQHSEMRMMIDPSIVRSAYGSRQYAAEAAGVRRVAGVGVSSVVHMESHWFGDSADAASSLAETRYVTDLPFGDNGIPELGALVIAADPTHAGFSAAIAQQTRHSGKVRGVRYKWARHSDTQVMQWRREPGVLSTAAFLRGFESIAENDLVFHSFAYSHQLGELDFLARRFPETTIVIEHLGLPVGVFGPVGAGTGATAAARAEILTLWKERMSMLAARPNIMVKVSGLALAPLGYGRETAGNIGGRDILAEMIGPLVLHVVDRFGPERVMFGSDMPIDRPNAGIEVGIGALLDVVGDRGDHLLAHLFADNAKRVYGI
ncbi:MAG: amidohydrolase family protein [Gordonia sp. (in: high G+C Gram-positive bacteria)]|jgi:predicted TIM-barrel fold metal-dependent hydrolase|nr:amidohydrolase family protein [Gordonia sp. (in: high G+C Gram-positive bacteria)]